MVECRTQSTPLVRTLVRGDQEILNRPGFVAILSLIDWRMHVAVRSNPAFRSRRSSIVNDAAGIDGEIDHAVGCTKYYLRLRSGHRLIGEKVANCPAAVSGWVVVMRLAPSLDEMT